MEHKTRSGWLLKAWILTLLLGFAPAAWSQPAVTCYVAEVPAPIVLPDDRVQEAGTLEVCLNRMYSPVAGFHRTSVNGRVAGLFISRILTETDTEGDARSYFVFVRLAGGNYKLESYARSDGRTRVTFEMSPKDPRVRSRWQVGQAKRTPREAAPPESERVVLLASLVHGS